MIVEAFHCMAVFCSVFAAAEAKWITLLLPSGIIDKQFHSGKLFQRPTRIFSRVWDSKRDFKRIVFSTLASLHFYLALYMLYVQHVLFHTPRLLCICDFHSIHTAYCALGKKQYLMIYEHDMNVRWMMSLFCFRYTTIWVKCLLTTPPRPPFLLSISREKKKRFSAGEFTMAITTNPMGYIQRNTENFCARWKNYSQLKREEFCRWIALQIICDHA